MGNDSRGQNRLEKNDLDRGQDSSFYSNAECDSGSQTREIVAVTEGHTGHNIS